MKGGRTMPKALHTLTKEQKMRICEWISHLKFSNGYGSNLARCVDMKEMRLQGMKSHDCHVFMLNFIPIMLPEPCVECVDRGQPSIPDSMFDDTRCKQGKRIGS
ncbi:hypothetical protein Sango_2079400 [Sesamum angolense]|uniref:Uncharacterized protein n=1 Tax=Sesamum angolense TaxID=2727404 RepID=A0AAE1WBA6_9LAMI|nr:hypothetical protein Sango_2079400 [Sesamum angolense]